MSDTVTLPGNLFWGSVGFAGLLLLCGLTVLAFRRFRPEKTERGAHDFIQDLGLARLPGTLTCLLAIVWLVLFLTFLAGLGWTMVDIVGRLDHQNADLRWSLLTLTAMTAGLGAVISVVFTLVRTQLSSRQTHAQEQDLITDRINKAVEMLGTDKTYKTDEGIDATRPNMEVRIGAIHALARIARENLNFHVQVMEILCAYVRENSPADSALPLDLPERPGDDTDTPESAWRDWRFGTEGEDGEFSNSLRQALDDLEARLHTRTDIQTALTVLGNRTAQQQAREAGAPDPERDGEFVFSCPFPDPPPNPDDPSPAVHRDWAKKIGAFRSEAEKRRTVFRQYAGYRLDLRRSNLQGYDLQRLDLRGARFEDAQMQGAVLWGAQMQGAVLWGAKMQGAVLWGAKMQGAVLEGAKMQGAVLEGAKMQGASLWGARMQGAVLRGAKMQGADLTGAQMQGADLRGAKMQGADLTGAQMQGADLEGARMAENTNLSAATLDGAALRFVDETTMAQLRPFWEVIFADGTVQLPRGETRPNWPEQELRYEPLNEETSPFHIEWRRWQEDPEGYTPPPPGHYDED